MPDVAVRSSAKASSASDSSITVSAPAGTTTGDVVIVIVNNNNDVTLSDGNGATPFTKDHQEDSAGGNGWTFAVFSRRIQGGDPSSYTFNTTVAGRISAIAVTFSDPHATDIFDVAPSAATLNKSDVPNTIDAPSISAADKAIHCAVCGSDQSSVVITPPGGGYTEQQQSTNQSASFCTKTITPAGATGAQTFSTINPGNGLIGMSFSIKNNAGAGTTAVPVFYHHLRQQGVA